MFLVLSLAGQGLRFAAACADGAEADEEFQQWCDTTLYGVAGKYRVKLLFMLALIIAATLSMVVMQVAPTFSWLVSWASNLAASFGLAATTAQTWFAYAELEDATISGVRRYGRTYEEVWRCVCK